MSNTQTALELLEAAAAEGKLSPAAAENIRIWLTAPYLAEYAPQVAEHLAAGRWKLLDDVFWTTIPFGTGGRRGMLYPIGTNAINDRTIGESAQGLADYVKEVVRGGGKGDSPIFVERKLGQSPEPTTERVASVAPRPTTERVASVALRPTTERVASDAVKQTEPLSCAIAYDTRHRSRDFAELCAGIVAAAGFQVFFLDGFRSTPELSFAVRYMHCDCGIMITASHNPPSDNAVKVYGSSGGQLLPPHDQQCIECVYRVKQIERIGWAEGLSSGRIVYCQEEVDAAYVRAVTAQSTPGPRDLSILYSPLHGVGASAVVPVLAAVGFREVEVFGPHAAPDPDFTNIPRHIANPENPAVFDTMIERARQSGAELILATDPDADRLGAAAPLEVANCVTQGGQSHFRAAADQRRASVPGLGPKIGTVPAWATLTGDQVGSLLTDSLLAARQAAGTLRPSLYIVKTLVTTELMRRIADHYGVQTAGNLLVGFKYIGGEMDRRGPQDFVFGAEESYGFLAGDHVRDKDAAVAAMLLAELAARLKARGQTLHGKLDELFLQYGCHREGQFSVEMPGEQGMAAMKALMAKLREHPPATLGGLKVARIRDYLHGTVGPPGVPPQALDGPTGDLIFLDLAREGNCVAVRPSGTEPKVKLYLFAYDPPAAGCDLATIKAAQAARLAAVEADLRAFAAG